MRSDRRLNPRFRVSERMTGPSTNGSGHLAGEVLLPGIGRTACGSVLIREESPPYADWLDFYLPIGALEELDPRTESLWSTESTVPYAWRAPIDGFLMDVAE